MKSSFAVALAFVVSTSAVTPSRAADAPPLVVATANTPMTTGWGVSVTVPKGWSSQSSATMLVMTPPEADLRVAIVDAGKAADANAAVAAAWQIFDPTMQRKVQLSTSAPGRQGWDARQSITYETSPNEHVDVVALALRKGDHWTVTILDGSEATIEKRGGDLNVAVASVRPAAFQRETFAGRKAHRLDAARIAELASFVKEGMRELGVPGTAIALFDHGKVVFEGGFGVRKLGDPTPVDARTLFIIASNTKGLTTLLLARLVDEGKLRWDEPVTDVYPSFRLGSAATTKKVQIRHLVCACTGLPRKDYDWIFNTSPHTPASTTFDQLATTEPTSSFGEAFQYNNLMASAAGYIAGHIVYPHRELGAAYDAAMERLIFDPLGMTETTFSMQRAFAGNHASQHGIDVDGHIALLDTAMNSIITPYRPAGGAWSSAHDLIKYVQDELTPGVLPNGKRFISAKNVLQRREKTVAIGENQNYGMGLMTDSTYGVTVVHHGGDWFGFHSDIYAIPSAGVGALILTNADNGVYLRGPFQRRLLELLYDGKPEAADNLKSVTASVHAAVKKAREQLTYPADPAVVSGLASRYVSPELGHIDVLRDAGGVTFDFGAWKSKVGSRKNDDGTVSLITTNFGPDGIEFVVGTNNGKRQLVTRDGQHVYAYTEL